MIDMILNGVKHLIKATSYSAVIEYALFHDLVTKPLELLHGVILSKT